ncbi:diaminopimelate decarboxylase [Candidatus Woesearchaeota archaeon CG_4_10_14_0_2_um_filter_33_13]|nr:MAG: diaminopimelate decarboxylase [Candidatus Woesearchaeota archaeon CG_4_10_14_0_2_um_filter_33_13]
MTSEQARESTAKQFIDKETAICIAENIGTPVYVYREDLLRANAQAVLNFPNAFGFTPRYAMKANSNGTILRLFNQMGLQIDASSHYEVMRAMMAGIPAEQIQLTAQLIPRGKKLEELITMGVRINACSLSQLEDIGKVTPGSEISVRINPGTGSGHCNRTNTGHERSSFGIWYDLVPKIKEIAGRYGLRISRMHTHIGSGSDPQIWKDVAKLSLGWATEFPDVQTLNLGGGFKVGRMPGEKTTDLQDCGQTIRDEFIDFYQSTGRQLHLEIEPGTYLVANAGAVLSRVEDVVSTDIWDFLKIDTGMTELTRISMYGAQHPITIIPKDNSPRRQADYIVVGKCCETGDTMTPEPGNPEESVSRNMLQARRGDLVIIGGAGAYCASMSTKNYNSFPEAPEVLIGVDGKVDLIREREELSELLRHEKVPERFIR